VFCRSPHSLTVRCVQFPPLTLSLSLTRITASDSQRIMQFMRHCHLLDVAYTSINHTTSARASASASASVFVWQRTVRRYSHAVMNAMQCNCNGRSAASASASASEYCSSSPSSSAAATATEAASSAFSLLFCADEW